MSNLANLFAKKFIARTDVKAIQRVTRDGAVIYQPHSVKSQNDEPEYIPWRREDLEAHLAGERTFGHYLLNTDSECKLFAFDIDLATHGLLPTEPLPDLATASEEDLASWEQDFAEDNLREAWANRKHVGRGWIKYQLRSMAETLARGISQSLDIPCAVAYSGNKGLHVYGFTGLISASQAREGARIVLDELGCFKPLRGDNFFVHAEMTNLEIEVFPKQDRLADSDSFGNLLRLPLGKNLKNPKDPTFFVDLTAPIAELRPVDPEWALTTGATNPWVRPGE